MLLLLGCVPLLLAHAGEPRTHRAVPLGSTGGASTGQLETVAWGADHAALCRQASRNRDQALLDAESYGPRGWSWILSRARPAYRLRA